MRDNGLQGCYGRTLLLLGGRPPWRPRRRLHLRERERPLPRWRGIVWIGGAAFPLPLLLLPRLPARRTPQTTTRGPRAPALVRFVLGLIVLNRLVQIRIPDLLPRDVGEFALGALELGVVEQPARGVEEVIQFDETADEMLRQAVEGA